MTFLKLARAWAIILPFMIANGIVREMVLKRFVSDPVAEVMSVMLGMAVIIIATRFLLRPLAGKSVPQLTRASITLLLLTVAFEFAFGRYVDRRSWSELVANYAIWHGHLWPVVLATLAFMPFVWGRWSLQENPHAR